MPSTTTLFDNIEDAGIKNFTNNTRLHNPRNLKAIDDSVEETGFLRSIAIDEEGETLAGNGTLDIARKRGANILIVDVDDPNTLVAVRRKNLTPQQKQRANLWDNRATDLSKNDDEAIKRLATENPKQRLLEGIYTEKEEVKLLKAHEDSQDLASGGSQAEEAAELKTSKAAKSSSTRMVQLFFDVETITPFVSRVRKLGKAVFPQAKNLTTQIDLIVEKAFAEWITESSEEAPLLDADHTANEPAAS